jgi:hypothetical protein
LFFIKTTLKSNLSCPTSGSNRKRFGFEQAQNRAFLCASLEEGAAARLHHFNGKI